MNTILEVTEVCGDTGSKFLVTLQSQEGDQNVQLRPVFLDQLLVLRHFSDPTIARPVRVGIIVETDIDVIVIGDFLEFLGNVVGDEEEGKLRVFKGYT